MSAAQFAVSVQVPVLLVMVTRLPTNVHGPIFVMSGVLLAFVVAAMVNLVLLAASAGAPVKVTVGANLMPIPCRLIVCVVGVALSVRTTLPLMLPPAVGANSMPSTQLASGSRDWPLELHEVLGPCKVKPGVVLIWLIISGVSGALPAFSTVTSCAALAVPTFVAVKLRLGGSPKFSFSTRLLLVSAI